MGTGLGIGSGRKYVIQKDNEIVRNAVNRFSYKQNQLMAYLLSAYVHTQGKKFINTVIPVGEFIKIMGIESVGGKNYSEVKKAIDSLSERNSVGIYNPTDESYTWRPFFKKIKLTKTQVEFVWNDEMYPDLIQFKNKYTQYLANDYLKLRTLGSQNLYEQLKSYQSVKFKPQVTFTQTDLIRILRVEDSKSYQKFNKLKSTALARAIKDINDKTDIYVEIENVPDPMDKRRAIAIEFYIYEKKDKQINYHGCYLTSAEINAIIKRHGKHKILDLGRIKRENQRYYTLLRNTSGGGLRSDYDIIMNFIKQDELKRAKQNDDDVEELTMDDYLMQNMNKVPVFGED